MDKNSEPELIDRVRTKERGEKHIGIADDEINNIASELDIDDSVVQVGKAIYRRALKEKAVENRSFGALSAASLYAACRVESKAYTQQEFSRVARGTSHKSFGRTYAEISRELKLQTGPIEPVDYVPELVERLGLSDDTQETAEKILDVVLSDDPEYISGNNPISLAAAAVYSSSLLNNQRKTQREVADAAQISVKPIRKHYQRQIESLDISEEGEIE